MASRQCARARCLWVLLTPVLIVMTSMHGNAAADEPIPASSGAQLPIASNVDLELVAQFGGEAWSVALDGDTLYVGGYRDSASRISAWDVADAAQPKFLGASDAQPGMIARLEVHEGLAAALLLNGVGRLVPYWSVHKPRFFDVSDSRVIPAVHDSINCPATDVDLTAQHAFVLCHGEVRMYRADDGNVGQPFGLPGGIGATSVRWLHPRARLLRVDSSVAYAVDAATIHDPEQGDLPGFSLHAVDVSDPLEAAVVGVVQVHSDDPRRLRLVPHDVVSADAQVFVVGQHTWLWSVDAADATSPRSGALVEDPQIDAKAAFLTGNHLYVVAQPSSRAGKTSRPNASSLRVFDVSRPEAPAIVGASDIPGSAMDVAARDDAVFVAAGSAGLLVFASRAAEPPSGGSATYLPVVGSALALGDAPAELAHGTTLISGRTSAVARQGDTIFAGVGAKVEAWRLRDEGQPNVVLTSPALSYRVLGIAAPQGEHGAGKAFVLGCQASRPIVGLLLADVSKGIRETSAIPIPGACSWRNISADRSGEFVFISGAYPFGVIVVDARDTGRLKLLGPLKLPGVSSDATKVVAVAAEVCASASAAASPAEGTGATANASSYASLAPEAADPCLVATNSKQLFLVGANKPMEPRILATAELDLFGLAATLVVEGHRAFIATSHDDSAVRMIVVDLSTMPSPAVTSVEVPAVLETVWSEGGRTYAAGFEPMYSWLAVLEVTDPAAPRLVGRLELSSGSRGDIVRATDSRFLIVGDRLVTVVDMSDPVNMQVVAVHLQPRLYDIDVIPATGPHEERLLVAAGSAGAWMLDPRSILPPLVLPLDSVDAEAVAVAHTDDAAHVGTTDRGDEDGVWQWRFDEPEVAWARIARTAVTVHDIAVPSRATGANMERPATLILAEAGGMRVFRTGARAGLSEMSRLGDMTPDAAAVHRNHAHLLGDRLWTIDVTHLGTPIHVGSLGVGGVDVAVGAGDHILYMASDEGLIVVDVSDPAAPFEVGRISGEIRAVAVDHDELYSAGDSIQSYDLADPTRPSLLSRRPLPCAAGSVAVGEHRVYVTCEDVGVFALPR